MSVFVKNAAVQFLLFMFFKFNSVYVKHKLHMLLCRVTGRLGISFQYSIGIYTVFIFEQQKFSIMLISMDKITTRG